MLYFFSLIIITISYFLFKNIAGTMAINRLNLFSYIFYMYLLIQSYIGATFIANGFSMNPVLAHVTDNTRFIGWLLISYVMIAVPLGAQIGRILFRIKQTSVLFNKYTLSSLEPFLSKNDSYLKFSLYLLSILSIFSALYVVVNIGFIPQLKIPHLNSEADVLTVRTMINRNFNGIYQIKSIFFEQMIPLLSFISFAYWKMTRKKSDQIWFIIMLLATLFVLTFTLSKSPLVLYLISFSIFYIYLNGYILWKYLIAVFMGSFLLLLFMFILIIQDRDLSLLLQHLLDRIFFHQISGTFLMLEIFPSQIEHIGFTSLSKPLSNLFFGMHSELSTRLAMEYAFPIATEEGRMNLLSTLFIGEAWANFGLLGVILAPIYIGLILSIFYYALLLSRKTPLLVSLLAYMSSRTSFASQFNQYIYNSTVIGIFLLLLLTYLFGIILKGIHENKN